MPIDGKRWRHVVIGTYNSWLPGDPREFRAEEHKIHSSGDYKKPPPAGEHAGLYKFSKKISNEPVVIPTGARETVGRKIVTNLRTGGHRVLAVSVSGMHAHILVELPDSLTEIRRIIGQCKTAASHAIREQLPGRVWGRYGGFKPINDKQHHLNTYNYILNQKDAWIRSYQEDEEDEDPEEDAVTDAPDE